MSELVQIQYGPSEIQVSWCLVGEDWVCNKYSSRIMGFAHDKDGIGCQRSFLNLISNNSTLNRLIQSVVMNCMHDYMLSRKKSNVFQEIVVKFSSKLHGWRAKLLSQVGKPN